MLEIYERLGQQCDQKPDTRLVLSHEQRDKGRLRTLTSDGEEVRLFLDRGAPLLVGEYLRSQCGRFIRVEGAIEEVTNARCEDWQTFSRACYHLGNRHTRVQIGNLWIRLLPDHVLDELLVQLGLSVNHEKHVFVPESGAYNGHHH